MNVSIILARLSFVASALITGASLIGNYKPTWALYAVAVAGAINAFTERVQGGKSKQ